MKILLAACAMLCTGCGEGVTPLMKAADSGDLSQLSSLIAKSPDLDKPSRYGWTALMHAARNGHRGAVEILLDAGADPNIVSQKIPPAPFATRGGYPATTALAEAIRNEHIATASLLIQRGAELDAMSVANAGKTGDIDLLAEMKSRGADFNRYSNNSLVPSALCAAAAAGNLPVVRWLCENGNANINLVLHHSMPLKSAVRHQQLEIVTYLLQQGADPNLNTGDPGYHHHYALGDAAMQSPSDPAESERVLEIIRQLLKYGANAAHQGHAGETILQVKRSQQANQRKFRAENIDHTTGSKVLERLEVMELHDEAVIAILKAHLAS